MPTTAVRKHVTALVVDDDRSTREMYAYYLSRLGVSTVEAEDGIHGLAKAISIVPDIISLDLSLQGMNGMDVCRSLGEREGTRDIPVIALTGSASEGEIEAARRAGCVSVLLKPCLPERLLQEIYRVLPGRLQLPGLAAMFEKTLQEADLFAAVRFLNCTTAYRYTGVYYFEPGLVKNLVLTDRENPDLRVGADVPWFDSYCMMTAKDGKECEIRNSLDDPRLTRHAARRAVMSYCGVLLRAPDDQPLGTLCHYDVCVRETEPTVFEGLRACRAAVERHIWERLGVRVQALPDMPAGRR